MELTGNTFFFSWETALILWLQARMGSFGTALASFLSMFGEELICVAVLGFLYWCYDKEYGKYVGLNVLTGLVAAPMIKNVFLRRRPYFDTPGISCLRPVEKGADIYDIAAQGYSFPSGHSTNSVAVFTSLPLYQKNYRRHKALLAIGIVIPLLVGISRFCLGVHYPTDVLCGWLLGLTIVLVMPVLNRKIKNRWLLYALLMAVTLPGFFYCKSTDYYTGVGLLAGFLPATIFEARFVRFEPTREPVRCILRVVGGVAVFLALNKLLKLPFPDSFLEAGTRAAYAVRSLRYAIVIFVVMGIYPMVFRKKSA